MYAFGPYSGEVPFVYLFVCLGVVCVLWCGVYSVDTCASVYHVTVYVTSNEQNEYFCLRKFTKLIQ